MKIDVYSHAIRVRDVTTDRDLDAMLGFCRPLIEFGLEKKGKRFFPKAMRTYAAAIRTRREFSFHRNQLDELKEHLFKRLGYVERLVPIVHHPISTSDYPKVEFDVRQMHDPREIQVGIIDYVLDTDRPQWDPIIKMVTLQTGGGKRAADDSWVRAPGGWRLNGSIRPGDQVIARDGTATKVLQIHPQKAVQVFAVTFEDGRFLEVCLDHLWGVRVDGHDIVLDTATIKEWVEKGCDVRIPLPEPDAGDGIERGEDPYSAGALSPDTPIEQLDTWLEAPPYQRHQYVEGLIDRCACRDVIHVPDLEHAINAIMAIRSMGGKASLEADNTVRYDLKGSDLKVTSVNATRVTDATCLTIEHPEALYVAQDYIVTHNTFVAQYCMNKLQTRTVIHFKGGYVERWKQDLEDTFNFKRGEFLIVRGGKDMIALQTMALEGTLKAKVIIITTATMRDYLKDYEDSNGNSKLYPIAPIDFYPKLQVGFRITDELHQEFHNNYRIDLYTHVPKSLGLSATMTASDKFKNKVYDIAYPLRQRHDGGGYNVYIGVTEIRYHMDQDVRLRYMGAQGYSHTTYEESIMRHKGLLRNYMKIIESAIYNRFIQYREDGQKALVFFARVDMCTLFVERLKKLYPELDIVRYVGSEGDSYEDILEADITVSTIGSAGTAIDIKNLRSTFMSTAIDSRQSNEQVLGRTRPLKDWPDVTPEFIYFSCMEIEQHAKYSANKYEYFKGKVVHHNNVMSRYALTLD